MLLLINFCQITLLVFLLSSPSLALTAEKKWTVSEVIGQTFVKEKPEQLSPVPLRPNLDLLLKPTAKILLIAAKDSLLEITESEDNLIRLGRATLAEFST